MTEQTGKRFGLVALIVCAVGIAFSALLNKLAMSTGLHPVWVNVFRLGVAIVGTLPFFLRKPETRRALRAMTRTDALLTLLSGLMLAIHFATWAAALKYADSVIAVTIWSTFSLMTVIGSAMLLHEPTPAAAMISMLIATAGVGICAIGASGSQMFGVIAALVAAVTQAVYTLCGRAVRKRVAMLPYTMGVYTIAFLCLLMYALLARLPAAGMDASGIGASVALAFVCTLGGHSMQNYALRYYKAPTVSMVILTEVFTGPLLVLVFLGEVPKPLSIAGGVIILIGVAWYMLYEWRRNNRGAVSGDRVASERARV